MATAVSGIVNELVGAGLGMGASLVISAPVIEEIMKAIGIWYAVRRKELDGVMDGVIYAGWTALGFAVVENFLYLGLAEQEGQLLLVFVLRGLLTPFAQPLFTAWTGIAIGAAVAKGKPISRPEGTPDAPVPTYGGDTVVRVPKRNQDDRQMMAQIQQEVAAIYFSADHLTGEARAAHIRRGVTEKFPS